MTVAERVRGLLVEQPGSVGERSRQRRWGVFQQLFPDVGALRIVDLGGRADSWMRAPVRPRSVVVVNVEPLDDPGVPWLSTVQADACALTPEQLGGPVDLVFSNSLLEHVGGYRKRRELAGVVHRLAPRHWVQTPYRYFPLEPHWLFPGMQFLPVPARALVARTWPFTHTAATPERAIEAVLSTELVGTTEVRHLFPGSTIVRERVGPFVKSLVAVRRGPSADAAGPR